MCVCWDIVSPAIAAAIRGWEQKELNLPVHYGIKKWHYVLISQCNTTELWIVWAHVYGRGKVEFYSKKCYASLWCSMSNSLKRYGRDCHMSQKKHVFVLSSHEGEAGDQIAEKMEENAWEVNCNCSKNNDKPSPFIKLIRYSKALSFKCEDFMLSPC